MKTIILQAGHSGRTSGSTGAPGEQQFNIDVTDKVAAILKTYGLTVKTVKADPTTAEIAGDYDLFLAIHYDADVYGKGGYLVDFCDPTLDGVTAESQRIAGILSSEYGKATGIVNHPERSNVNTRKYYMWAKLSSKTPCVLIECGVGQHKPDDYEILFNQREKVVTGIVKGILSAFGIAYKEETVTTPAVDEDTTRAIKALVEYKNSNDELKNGNLEGAINSLIGWARDIKTLQSNLLTKETEISNLNKKIDGLESSQKDLQKQIDELGVKLSENQKTAEDWQKTVNTANQKISKLTKDLDDMTTDRNTWKGRYEAKCKETLANVSNSAIFKELLSRITKKK